MQQGCSSEPGSLFFCLGQPFRTAPRYHRPRTATNCQPPTATNRQLPSFEVEKVP